MLRDCVVLAIEGTHASGKTTLTHALATYYRERGIHRRHRRRARPAQPADTRQRVRLEHRIRPAALPRVPGLRPGDLAGSLAMAGAAAGHRSPPPLSPGPSRCWPSPSSPAISPATWAVRP
jgi:hypothetical protein